MDKLVEVKALRQSIRNLFSRLQTLVPQGSYDEFSKEELIMIATGIDEVMPLIEEIENKVAVLNTKMELIENDFASMETNMFTSLSEKADANHTHNDMVDAINNKSDMRHTHDDRYYTESEVDTKLSSKSDTSHSHTPASIGAANSSHTHNKSQITDFPTIPSVGNGTVTIKQNGTTKGTFTMNQSGNTTVELTDNNTTYAAASTNPKANGTAAVGTSAKYAREDHIHPVQTSVSGNAGTATKLATARKIGNASFDGSANITVAGIGAAASSHTHDDRYYTESEINTKIQALQNTINNTRLYRIEVINNVGSDLLGYTIEPNAVRRGEMQNCKLRYKSGHGTIVPRVKYTYDDGSVVDTKMDPVPSSSTVAEYSMPLNADGAFIWLNRS